MANRKKAVLFTIDQDVYDQLRYKKKNMSGHVNYLIRQSVFEGESLDLSQVNTMVLLSVLESRYKDNPFLSTVFRRELEHLYDKRRSISSNPDANL